MKKHTKSSLVKFGKHLKKTRVQRGLTQMQLAKRSRLSQPTICSAETGRYGLSDKAKNRVLKSLSRAKSA